MTSKRKAVHHERPTAPTMGQPFAGKEDLRAALLQMVLADRRDHPRSRVTPAQPVKTVPTEVVPQPSRFVRHDSSMGRFCRVMVETNDPTQFQHVACPVAMVKGFRTTPEGKFYFVRTESGQSFEVLESDGRDFMVEGGKPYFDHGRVIAYRDLVIDMDEIVLPPVSPISGRILPFYATVQDYESLQLSVSPTLS